VATGNFDITLQMLKSEVPTSGEQVDAVYALLSKIEGLAVSEIRDEQVFLATSIRVGRILYAAQHKILLPTKIAPHQRMKLAAKTIGRGKRHFYDWYNGILGDKNTSAWLIEQAKLRTLFRFFHNGRRLNTNQLAALPAELDALNSATPNIAQTSGSELLKFVDNGIVEIYVLECPD
jgi:hypothetical protein